MPVAFRSSSIRIIDNSLIGLITSEMTSCAAFDDYFSTRDRKMIPSPPLSEGSSIKLRIDKDLMETGHNRKLVALEIMFGTRVRVNPGVAQLILERENGEKVNIDFPLPGITGQSLQTLYHP